MYYKREKLFHYMVNSFLCFSFFFQVVFCNSIFSYFHIVKSSLQRSIATNNFSFLFFGLQRNNASSRTLSALKKRLLVPYFFCFKYSSLSLNYILTSSVLSYISFFSKFSLSNYSTTTPFLSTLNKSIFEEKGQKELNSYVQENYKSAGLLVWRLNADGFVELLIGLEHAIKRNHECSPLVNNSLSSGICFFRINSFIDSLLQSEASLLEFHKKSPNFVWSFLGGKREKTDSNFCETACREFCEETNLLQFKSKILEEVENVLGMKQGNVTNNPSAKNKENKSKKIIYFYQGKYVLILANLSTINNLHVLNQINSINYKKLYNSYKRNNNVADKCDNGIFECALEDNKKICHTNGEDFDSKNVNSNSIHRSIYSLNSNRCGYDGHVSKNYKNYSYDNQLDDKKLFSPKKKIKERKEKVKAVERKMPTDEMICCQWIPLSAFFNFFLRQMKLTQKIKLCKMLDETRDCFFYSNSYNFNKLFFSRLSGDSSLSRYISSSLPFSLHTDNNLLNIEDDFVKRIYAYFKPYMSKSLKHVFYFDDMDDKNENCIFANKNDCFFYEKNAVESAKENKAIIEKNKENVGNGDVLYISAESDKRKGEEEKAERKNNEIFNQTKKKFRYHTSSVFLTYQFWIELYYQLSITKFKSD